MARDDCKCAAPENAISHDREKWFVFSFKGAAWEACDDFERLCAEHIRLYVHSVERMCSEMTEKVGEAEKAGVDWTDCRLGRLQREVLELRRGEDQIDRLTLTEDPIQFLQVILSVFSW